MLLQHYKVCTKSFGAFYYISYFIKWAKTSWTYSRGRVTPGKGGPGEMGRVG